ncbi:MAG: phosphodiester glycosidase family protein [Anaerolineales bacterium]
MTSKRVLSTVLVVTSACLLALLLLAGSAWVWIQVRNQPAEKNQALFQGIHYVRDVRQSPRPLVVHIVTVKLRESGIEFLVTPGDPEAELPLQARATSSFLEEFDLQIAVNGDGVTPWRSNSWLDYYPHAGDPVDPIGLSASRGVVYSPHRDAEPTLYLSRDNRARFNNPLGGVYNAISGNRMLVENGKSLVAAGVEDTPQPRTAVALDKSRRQLIILVVDGRQPGYSEGATLEELADLILEFGGHSGMNMDGGGSSTLVMEGKNGKALILNSPIDHNIPGNERTVGNHLGIFARQNDP